MAFTVVFEMDGLETKLDTLAESANDLEKPLRRFGGYLRKRAIERYRAQDFAPLAQGTVEKRTQKGLRSLEGKLQSDLRKAIRRAGGAKGSGLALAMASEARGVRNRRAVLAEFQRRHGRSLKDRVEGHELAIKQLASLGAREDRAMAKAVGRPILGGLPSTLEVDVGRGVVTLISRTREHWTDAHNQGDVVGHGARVPKRETLKLEEQDLDVFVEILREHHLMPLQEGA